ncbi:MAG: DUF1893 domain-containing protein [Bacillota bacterium]|nr:DUF1893 domain-containing protein [Bacillota bacterium]
MATNSNKSLTDSLKEAESLLRNGGFALVYQSGGSFIGKTGNGIKPLFEMAAEKDPKTGEVLADKVIGRAAAFLCLKIGFKAVFAFSMSEGAIKLFETAGVEWSCVEKTDRILNRRGDDLCPMEKATMECKNEEEAYLAIRRKLVEFGLIEENYGKDQR